MARISKLLSFSNVVACLALFVALGGSVYAAGRISGKQIRVSSLPGNRIKPKTIPANRIKPHSLTGAQINQKTLTGISAAALADVQYVATTIPLAPYGSPRTLTANCPSGSYAIGGGASLSNEYEARINDSGPSVFRTGWTATGIAYGSGSSTTMTVTAVCVPLERPGGKVEYHSGG